MFLGVTVDVGVVRTQARSRLPLSRCSPQAAPCARSSPLSCCGLFITLEPQLFAISGGHQI